MRLGGHPSVATFTWMALFVMLCSVGGARPTSPQLIEIAWCGETPQEVLQAAQHVHEKIDEVDLSQTTVLNMFGGTALTLAGQLERTPRLIKDMKELLRSAGKAPAEIALAQRQAKELLKNPEIAEIVEAHEEAICEVEHEVQELETNLKALEPDAGSAPAVLEVAPPLPAVAEPAAEVDLSQAQGPGLQYQIAQIEYDQKVNALSHKLLLTTAQTVEKIEAFLENNPALAKTLRRGVDGINTVLMLAGVKGLLTSGLPKTLVALGLGEAIGATSAWAGGVVESLIAEVATSESEAQRFMDALKRCAKTAGFVAGLKIATKTTQNLRAPKNKAVIKDALSEKPVVKDGKVFLGERELGTVPQHGQQRYRGGAYKNVRTKTSMTGKEAHHIPADSISSVPRDNGLAIQMDIKDHRATSSWGPSKRAQAYRETIKQKLEEGDIRGAIAQEGWDVKRVGGTRYNEALREMLEHGKSIGFIPPK